MCRRITETDLDIGMNTDKVIIRDLIAHGTIGISSQERENPQAIVVNIEIATSLKQAGETDKIEDCIDYSIIAEKVRVYIEKARRFTVEALAEDIARLCLEDSRVDKVCVRVEKPEAVKSARSVGVEIVRSRQE